MTAMLLQHLISSVRRFGEVVRWSEPWDIEVIDDPLYVDGPLPADQTPNLWA